MTEREMIDQFIRERGVTRCPAAYVAYTHVELSPEDLAAHRRHEIEMRAVIQEMTKGLRRSWSRGAKRGGDHRPRAQVTLR